MEFEESARKDLAEYQNLSQQLQMILMQKQQSQLQLSEIDRALNEVESSSNAQIYKIVGSVMITKTKEQIVSDLAEEKDSLKMRMDVFSKQEDRLKSKLSDLTTKLSELENKMKSNTSLNPNQRVKRQFS